MILIERFFIGHMLAAVAALAIGLALSPVAPLTCSLILVMLGLVWFAVQQRKRWGLEDFLLSLFLISAGIGFYLRAPGWLLLVGAVAAMGAWDLSHFLQRLDRVERVELNSGLGRQHLRRLAMVEGIGVLIGLVGLAYHPQVGFWWEALLVIIVVIGLSWIIARVRKETGG